MIAKRSGTVEAEEGCLSFPEIYAPVKRSEKIVISAYNLAGEEVNYELTGLFARAAQHEYDHLDGVLFIDRLTPSGLLSVKQALSDLELEFQGDRQRGVIPDDQQIATRLAELGTVADVKDNGLGCGKTKTPAPLTRPEPCPPPSLDRRHHLPNRRNPPKPLFRFIDMSKCSAEDSVLEGTL